MTQEKININNRTLWSNLWNDNPDANKNKHVEVIEESTSHPFTVMAHVIKHSDHQGWKGRLDAKIKASQISY